MTAPIQALLQEDVTIIVKGLRYLSIINVIMSKKVTNCSQDQQAANKSRTSPFISSKLYLVLQWIFKIIEMISTVALGLTNIITGVLIIIALSKNYYPSSTEDNVALAWDYLGNLGTPYALLFFISTFALLFLTLALILKLFQKNFKKIIILQIALIAIYLYFTYGKINGYYIIWALFD